MTSTFQIYRSTTIGQALSDTLSELQQQNEIREDLTKRVQDEFDKVIVKKLNQMVQSNKVTLQGTCSNYNNCDDVWKFMVNKLEIKGESVNEKSNHCRIVALDSENNPIRQRENPTRQVPNKKGKKNQHIGKRRK